MGVAEILTIPQPVRLDVSTLEATLPTVGSNSVHREQWKLNATRTRLERLLPWRSVDGRPLGMAILEVGCLGEDDGSRTPGGSYAIVGADSIDAADELRRALAAVAGLTEEDWHSGWFETPARLLAIRIYPKL